MESISELRKICQSSRPSIFNDFLNRLYYKVSIYFTWVCIFLRLSANQVTIISVVFSIMGGALIASGDKLSVFIGFFFFHIFAILDMSDGEVARYRKEGGMTGHFLDWYMHFITSLSMMTGFMIHSFDKLHNNLLILIAIIAIAVPIFDKIITSSGWTVIAWTRLRDLKNDQVQKKPNTLSNKNQPILVKRNLLFKLIKFLTLHFFQDHWIKLSMIILSFIDLIFYICGIQFFDYMFLTIIYIGIAGPIYIIHRVYKIMTTSTLFDGYDRLFVSKEKPQFPDADFL